MNKLLTISSSPHIRSKESTKSLMLDVIIALVPALTMAIYYYGMRAAMLVAVCVLTCVVCEAGYERLLKKEDTTKDLSAVVTGILLAFNLPAAATWWMGVIGSAFAIIVVKCLYGGIGKNFVNPALAGRAFLISWVAIMTTFVAPKTYLPMFGAIDALSSATPLAVLKGGEGVIPSLMEMFVGARGGCIGEVSVFAILLGGGYLIARKVISIRIPLSYIGTVALIAFIFPRVGGNVEGMLVEIMSGGLMLGAFFMATDYATSPITKRGQIIYGVGCGLLTVLIRYFGGYPEGVSYSILLMNICVWLIDSKTSPKKFGEVAK